DPRCLAGQVPQVIELGTTHAAAALDSDVADGRAVGLEHALDALSMGDLANREGGVQATVAPGDDHALVRLHALAVAFHYLHLHDDGVTRFVFRDGAGHALLLDFLDYLAHVRSPRSFPAAAAAAPAAASRQPRASIPLSTRCASGDSCAARSRSGRRRAVRANAC